MNKRLVKFYLALIFIGTASYLFLLSLQGQAPFLQGIMAPLGNGLAFVLSVVGMGVGGFIGWRTVLEELAVRSD
ncbi:MAG: hypothetical protein AB7P69_28725 [Candidatus Binatia bacterium]